jgi:hypothetical protein
MRRSTPGGFLLVLACLIGTGQAAEPAGTWKITPKQGFRARDAVVRLQQEGGRWTGILFHHLGHRSELQDVRYEDGKLSFVVRDQRRGSGTEYEATVGSDTMQGHSLVRRRDSTQRVEWEAKRTHDAPLADEITESPPVAADIDLNEGNYQLWRDYVLPDPKEMAWEQIPWLTTFKDGILAADSSQKPLLLWTMNGHPLGCT